MKRSFLFVALAALVVAGTASASAPQKPWLWQCSQIHNLDPQYRCYVRLLLEDVQRSGNPARELPRIDQRVVRVGGTLEGSCHVLMHEVGREYARAHHLTLSALQRYVPRSNNPNCSAGFGMGVVMYLGPQILRSGGASAAHACAQLPTRYREYTCVHGLGHALLRAYHGALGEAVSACRKLKARFAPDCAQGVFHDYWISLRGDDGTTRPRHAMRSPRVVCDGRFTYVRPCWYRYFLEQPLAAPVRNASDLRRACRGLAGIGRFGCISAATLVLSSNPFEQLQACTRMRGLDARACTRGVADQALASEPSRQLRLIRMCRTRDCFDWIGRTLAVVTNGRFRCDALLRGRTACSDGAARVRDALVTFS